MKHLKSLSIILLITHLLILYGCSKREDESHIEEDNVNANAASSSPSDTNEPTEYKTLYYDTGEKRLEGPTLNGILHGKCIAWYKNGKKQWEGEMINGKHEGKLIVYDKNGESPEEFYFKNGKVQK